MPIAPTNAFGLSCPISGDVPDQALNPSKFGKPLHKLINQKLKLKKPMTHRKKRHHRVSYY